VFIWKIWCRSFQWTE